MDWSGDLDRIIVLCSSSNNQEDQEHNAQSFKGAISWDIGAFEAIH